MRIAQIARTSITTVSALLAAVVITIASTLSLAVALAATALIVPGTGTPNANIVGDYLENARDYYIAPFNPDCTEANDCALQGIDYPAQFWPIPLPGWGGLSGAKWDVSTGEGLANLNSTLVNTVAQNPPNTPVILFGYSQGGNIVSREKRNLAYLPEDQTYLSFVMIGNANRPNGGLFERLAFLGHVPILDATFGLPAPTDTCDHICATDIAFRYDGVADFPLYPLNALAVLNAIAGFWYVHGTYLAPNANSDPGELPDGYTPEELAEQLADEDNWQDHGDTRYITIPTKTLPIVRPFLEFANATGTGFLIKPIVTLLSPVLEVLIETGYDRSLSYGVPAPFRLIPRINPITLAGDVVKALGQGFRDAFGTRPAVSPDTDEVEVAPTPTPTLVPTGADLDATAPAEPTRAEKRAALREARDAPRSVLSGRTDSRLASEPADSGETTDADTDTEAGSDGETESEVTAEPTGDTKDSEHSGDAGYAKATEDTGPDPSGSDSSAADRADKAA
ncbi:PE-PPE domain-containing protein [Mycobacterium sp. AMU20-3851]|uniref:PE-PPE domain-containing protein n=1 Tax=Mycobacterium sp. AMU20-3851 TaxID=3122055 RepID=UPI0037553211